LFDIYRLCLLVLTVGYPNRSSLVGWMYLVRDWIWLPGRYFALQERNYSIIKNSSVLVLEPGLSPGGED
jgi:hypothetical protein